MKTRGNVGTKVGATDKGMFMANIRVRIKNGYTVGLRARAMIRIMVQHVVRVRTNTRVRVRFKFFWVFFLG